MIDKETKEKAYLNAVQAAVKLVAEDEVHSQRSPDIVPKTVCINM